MKYLLEKYKIKSIKPYLWIFTIAITSVCYFIINHSKNDNIHSLYTELDSLIPFVNAFIIPYMIYMPNLIICFILLCYFDEERYCISLITLNIANFICLIIFLLFQTYVPRPIIVHDDFLCNAVKYIYGRDNPYNCFPSIHVAATFSVLKGINRAKNMKPKCKITLNIIGWLVIISTQFVKQHVIMDLLVALVLVEAVYKCVEYLFNNKYIFRWVIPQKREIDDNIKVFK